MLPEPTKHTAKGRYVRTDDFDYELPGELIAQHPAEQRDHSRLLVVHRESGQLSHARFTDLPDFLGQGDLLVVNDSRVLPARLHGIRERTGGSVEILLLNELEVNRWLCLARPARRVRVGDVLRFGEGEILATVAEEQPEGRRVLAFQPADRPLRERLERIGELPLPPYIREQPADPERYQTVYAREPGSVAAPTAGLHFTPELLERLEARGCRRASVTLHVGLGTFRPVQAASVTDHVMHAEYGELPSDTVAAMRVTRLGGGRIVAVGTTAVRVLETAARQGADSPWSGWTDIFIYPGFQFRVCDALITNFHLPRSTLLMLVSAFAGKELIDRAYAEAIRERYRFFSFGDAMLIL